MRHHMGALDETVTEAVERGPGSHINTIVAFSVAITATFTALCNVKDGNIVQGMAQAQANGVDAWSYYQAKSTKQYVAESVLDQLKIQRDLTQGGTGSVAEARALIDKKILEYQGKISHYEAEKAEIKKTAEGYQKEYDRLNLHDDQFDMAEAMMSVAIALFGVTALTQKRALLVVAGVFAGVGALLGLAGFLGLRLHPEILAKLLT
jgi:hypothetical protein